MSRTVIRRTLVGALVVGGVFGVVAGVQILRSGVSPVDVLQPLLVFVVIGATTGALAGPLVGAAWAHWRRTDDGS